MNDGPKPPDPYTTANAQTQSNIATAKSQQGLNMVNQTTPYGSLTYSQTGTNPDGSPQYGANVSFSQPQQQIYDAGNANKMGQMGIASGLLAGKSGALSGNPLDLSWGATEANLDALGAKTLDPQFAQRTNQLTQDLYNRGIRPGDEQYQIAMDQLGRDRGAAYNNLYLTGHNTAVNDLTSQYYSPLQTYQQLMQGTGPQSPTGANVSTPQVNIPGTNISGLIEQNYQQDSNNANARNGQIAGLIGTGLGVAAAPFTGGASLAGAMGGLFGKGGGTPNYGQSYNMANGGYAGMPVF